MPTKLGAIFLIAGTCIGSGMIALPMVLAKVGIIPSISLMLFIWYIMYHTSLVNLELNLQANEGLPLGTLGRKYSGKIAELVGGISLKLLSYSLLAVFIYGGSSIIQEYYVLERENFGLIAIAYACAALCILWLPIKMIDLVNRVLFCVLLLVTTILIAGLIYMMNWSNLPWFSAEYGTLSSWALLIPIVFTSFGFQVIFHTLTTYCKKNAVLLKKSFLWGTLIPATVYILWTCSVLSVVYDHNPALYEQMAMGSVDVGTLVQILSNVSQWKSVQILVWWISTLAIMTSVVGVGIGLCDSLKISMQNRVQSSGVRYFLAPIITILPALLAVLYIPNAFIAVLSFAGMVLAIIAILLPIYLLWKLKPRQLYYAELKTKWLLVLSTLVAGLVIVCELFNTLYR